MGLLAPMFTLPEVGKVNEEIDTDQVTGEDLTISFNPTYLIDSLKALNSEKVTISFISAVRPFTLCAKQTLMRTSCSLLHQFVQIMKEVEPSSASFMI